MILGCSFFSQNSLAALLHQVCWNLETMIETKTLNLLDEEILFEVEGRLQKMQQAKFPFTRVPDGYYQRMSVATAAAEEERKQQRRQDLEIAQRASSAANLQSISSHKLLDSNQASFSSIQSTTDQPVLITVEKFSPDRGSAEVEEDAAGFESDSSPRLDPQKQGSGGGELDIFEMELENEGSGSTSNNSKSLKTPKKGKASKSNSWAKFDLQQLHRLDINSQSSVQTNHQAAGGSSSSSSKQWQIPSSTIETT